MNTGIQDAYNLAWKLALVVRGESDPALLDSYDAERHRIGEILLQGTDRMFAAVAGHGRISTFIRTYAPVLAARAFNTPLISRRVIRFMSELGIRYRQSPLSREGPGAERAVEACAARRRPRARCADDRAGRRGPPAVRSVSRAAPHAARVRRGI